MDLSKKERDPRKYRRVEAVVLPGRSEEKVYEAIEKWPGIIITELCEYVGLSREPVRRAIKTLAEQGKIKVSPVYVLDNFGTKRVAKALYAVGDAK